MSKPFDTALEIREKLIQLEREINNHPDDMLSRPYLLVKLPQIKLVLEACIVMDSLLIALNEESSVV
jgi:hypothetical protein